MRFTEAAFCLALLFGALPAPAHAAQLPGPLVSQINLLTKVLGDGQSSEDKEGRMLHRFRLAQELVLTIFSVQNYAAGEQSRQFIAVFAVEVDADSASHFRLVDVLQIGGPGWRVVESLAPKIVHNDKTGETSITILALQAPKASTSATPARRMPIQLKLKRGRLYDLSAARIN